MSTLAKVAMGMIGHLEAKPLETSQLAVINLPAPAQDGGLPLMEALRLRGSQREFLPTPLPPQVLSDLLWAAYGVNRPAENGHTAPTARNAQEIDVYAAMPTGLYLYEPVSHCLQLVESSDVRRVTGYQDFVDDAPLDLIYVADHGRMKQIPAAQRDSFASVAAGAISENVYLYCASAGLATVIRAWIDRTALGEAMGLPPDGQILLSQTVGYPTRKH